MLRVLHSLYNASPKRYRKLKQLAEAWETSIPKPTKATGTCWIEHKVNAMKIALEHYGAFLSHIESLSQTDSNPVRQAELKGYLNKWKSAIYPIYLAIYLDILSPIRRLSLGFQQELHDPVKAVCRIREFSWTMVKLHALIDKSLNEPASRLTHYKRLLAELETGENDETVYQGISLTGFNVANNDVPNKYAETITQIVSSMEKRFQDLQASRVFTHIISILDIQLWPKESDGDISFGDGAVSDLLNLFKNLLDKNGCDVDKAVTEWDTLKTFVQPLVSSNKEITYLEVWKRVLTNDSIKAECENILHLIEILLIIPFTNVKVERMFSRMNRIKSDWRNRLNQDTLDDLLRISEDGPTLDDFNPDVAIDKWFTKKVRRLKTGRHNYPAKRKRTADGNAVTSADTVDIAEFVLSDLESPSSDEDE